jgi:hypothetical protein
MLDPIFLGYKELGVAIVGDGESLIVVIACRLFITRYGYLHMLISMLLNTSKNLISC